MCNRGVPPRKTSPRKYLQGDHYLDYKLTFDQVEEIHDSIEWIAEENEEPVSNTHLTLPTNREV